jgi:hypothetical protein
MSIKTVDCTINFVARKVLAQVKRNLKAYACTGEAAIELYVNGRERGFAITTIKGVVAFSEARCSDEIVVYQGARNQFAWGTYIPNDEVYNDSTMFRGDKIQAAARFISSMVAANCRDDDYNFIK